MPQRPRKGGKGGKHLREEPTSMVQLQACPLAMDSFRHQSCYYFCQLISQFQNHRELARLFILHLHDGHVNLAGVNFILSPETIAEATGIPNIRKQWNK